MAIDWAQGQVLGSLRRFTFSRLKGKGKCTLVARSGGRDLVLLRDQVIDDPSTAIRWDHLLEELVLPAGAEPGKVRFEEVQGQIRVLSEVGEEDV
jgi:hypothetical protein